MPVMIKTVHPTQALVRLQLEAPHTSLSMGDCDVQGMLRLRLPAPGLLRLAVRRVQESQGQAPLARPQSIHLESPQARTGPCAGEGPAVCLSRRRAGRMRQAPWTMWCPQHHSRPLADRTHRARRSRPGPQRPATHARLVQALPRQQDRKDETFRLQQQTKPQLTHTGFGTKTKHSIEAKPTTPAARVERHERQKRPSLLDSIRDSSQQQASQTKTVAKQTEANRQNTHGDTP